MPSPLSFQDLFGYTHIEPSVTGLIEVETTEGIRPNTFNDLILVSAFRSGPTGVMKRHRTLSGLAALRDPDRTGDRGVALARAAKGSFADDGVFGAADILSVRVDSASTPALASSRTLAGTAFVGGGAVGGGCFKVATADLGGHTTRAWGKLVASATLGLGKATAYRKLSVGDDARLYEGDLLGIAFNLKYGGAAATSVMSIDPDKCVLTISAPAVSTEKLTLNAVTYVFTGTPGAGEVLVAPGATFATTGNALVAALAVNSPELAVSIVVGSSTAIITLTGGVTGFKPSGSTGASIAVLNSGLAARLRIVQGSGGNAADAVDLPFANNLYKTIGQLAGYLDSLPNVVCKLDPHALSSAPSSSLDIVNGNANLGVDIKTPTDGYDVTNFTAACVTWLNTKTRDTFVGTVLSQFGSPTNDTLAVALTGGRTSPILTGPDYDATLDLIAANTEVGGILLMDSSDPVVWALVNTWISEQRTLGKWFRAYLGCAPGVTANDAINYAGALDSSRVRLVQQRVGFFTSTGTISYVDPIFLAAMLAGGCAGNKPWVHPLTNKRLRIAGIEPTDNHAVEVRERMLDGGVTVIKEESGTFRVTLQVTTSRDPDRRMPRVVSEIDTVDSIDASFRNAFLPFRGKWAGVNFGAQVFGVGGKVLQRFADEGAIAQSTDEQGVVTPAWQWGSPAFTYLAGVLNCEYQVRVPGELNHASLHGVAEYARFIGNTTGVVEKINSTIPVK